MTPDDDPLIRMLRPLAAVLLATALNVIVAALIGGALPLAYSGRAWTYAGLLLYVLAGAVLLFRASGEAEARAGARLTAARVGRWMLSIWLWPLLLVAGRRRD
jgi:putative Ca2+/H+ antiporter (TMEM165/GDT1 family)